jgi:IS30 family transposase
VAVKLGEDWSPRQIAGWLVWTFPDSPEMWVSHETIYLTCSCRPVVRSSLSWQRICRPVG